MDEWRVCKWGDIATLAYGKGLKGYRDHSTTDVRVFGTNGPIGFTHEALDAGPGVIVGRKGAYRGIHYSAGAFFVIDTAFYLQPVEDMDLRWAYYSLLTQDINGLDSGSAIPSTSRDSFYALDVSVPPLPEQRAIAEVLGALDDKIESNRRTIELTSQLCDAKFLNWNVRHLPLDVETTFDDFCDVFGGATPKTSEPDYWGGPHAWATPSDVTALGSVFLFGTGRTITDEGLDRCSASLHPPGSIFMTSRATIGAFAVNQVPCVPNQGFIVVRPKDDAHRWFLFHEMRRRVPEMLDRANGSTFKELSRGSFKEMSLLVPADDGALSSLDRELSPLHERACIAARESAVAASLRDALLPELLSGRIRVPEARELVEDAS